MQDLEKFISLIKREEGTKLEKHQPNKRATAYQFRYDVATNRIIWENKGRATGHGRCLM